MRIKRFIASLLSSLLAFPNAALVAPATPPDVDLVEQQLAGFERVVRMADALRPLINRAPFDLQVMVDQLDYEPEQIIRFVQKNIAFQQYPGVLRGARGTMMAQSGNAIDQALLLATLLRNAGYDVRIAATTLNDSQANMLLAEMLRPAPERLTVGDAEGILAVLEQHIERQLAPAERVEFIRELESDPPAAGSNLFPDVEQTARFLQAKLARARVDIGGASSSITDLMHEARAYHWVQYRDGPADPWTDVHPAFSAAPSDLPAPEQFFGESIPESLQHRLRFQMFVEVRRGDQLEVVAVSEAWERPIANLNAEPMVFGNLPDSMLGGGMPSLDLDASLKSASYFVPVFNGGPPPGARFFDVNGNIIDPMVAGSAAAGLFKTVGDSFLKTAGDVGGEPAKYTLTAQWVEYTFIEPGGETRTVRRTTFDRIGPAARASGSIPKDLPPTTAADARTLMQRHTFMIQTGRTPRGLALDYGLARMLETYPAVIAYLRIAQLGVQPSAAEAEQLARIGEEWSGHLQLFTIMDGADTVRNGVASYRSGPGLVVHRQGLSDSGSNLAAIDVIANPRRSVGRHDGILTLDPYANLLAGVWETAMEGILLGDETGALNTESVFADALAADVPIAVLQPGARLSGLNLTDDALFHLEADLASDHAVVVPRSVVPGEMTGWWRVNVQTGEKLGQLSDGRGATLIDYVNLVSFAFSCGMLGYGVAGCGNTFGGGSAADNARYGCCIFANFVMFGIGALIYGLGSFSVASSYAVGLTAANASSRELLHAALMAATGGAAYDVIASLIPVCQ